jgi:hypothetical protein
MGRGGSVVGTQSPAGNAQGRQVPATEHAALALAEEAPWWGPTGLLPVSHARAAVQCALAHACLLLCVLAPLDQAPPAAFCHPFPLVAPIPTACWCGSRRWHAIVDRHIHVARRLPGPPGTRDQGRLHALCGRHGGCHCLRKECCWAIQCCLVAIIIMMSNHGPHTQPPRLCVPRPCPACAACPQWLQCHAYPGRPWVRAYACVVPPLDHHLANLVVVLVGLPACRALLRIPCPLPPSRPSSMHT